MKKVLFTLIVLVSFNILGFSNNFILKKKNVMIYFNNHEKVCLIVSGEKQEKFNYSIKNDKLVLKNNSITHVLIKTEKGYKTFCGIEYIIFKSES